MKKRFLRLASLVAVMLLVAASLPVSAERPKGFDDDGCMPLITEPGNCTEELIYCRGDEDLTIDGITWVDSAQGKAVRFNGIDEYFRIGYNSLHAAFFQFQFHHGNLPFYINSVYRQGQLKSRTR